MSPDLPDSVLFSLSFNFFFILSDFECQVFKKNSTLLVSLGYISPKDGYWDIIYEYISQMCEFGYFNICGNIECVMYLNC